MIPCSYDLYKYSHLNGWAIRNIMHSDKHLHREENAESRKMNFVQVLFREAFFDTNFATLPLTLWARLVTELRTRYNFLHVVLMLVFNFLVKIGYFCLQFLLRFFQIFIILLCISDFLLFQYFSFPGMLLFITMQWSFQKNRRSSAILLVVL